MVPVGVEAARRTTGNSIGLTSRAGGRAANLARNGASATGPRAIPDDRAATPEIGIKLLRAFVTVAAKRNFTAAAQLIGCSQAAVSMRVQALERRLGVCLFVRARFNLRLTPTGEDLLPKVRTFLDQYDRLFVNVGARTVTGPVRVGAVEGFGAGLLAELPQRVCRRYAAIELEVVCDHGAGLRQALKAGSLDLALLVEAEETSSATMLGQPRLQWVGTPDFAFREDGSVPFAGYPEGCPVRAAALAALEDRGVAYHVALTSWNDRVLDHAVRSGWAIAAMPETLVPTDLRVIHRPSLLPRLDRIGIQLLQRPGLDDEAASAVGREIADICQGR